MISAAVRVLAALAVGMTCVSAARPGSIPGSAFEVSPFDAALASMPAWHFDEKTCLPSNAIVNGGQNPGNAPDNCNVLKLNHNCPTPPAKNGQHTDLPNFPTYYAASYCGGDDSWRILYDVYFTKDTGHRHDWEWAAIHFAANGDGTYSRAGIWLEQDGDKPYVKWDDIPDTFTGTDDIDQYGNRGREHPKLYMGKFHHSVHVDQQTKFFPITCPPNSASEYRSDDYRHFFGELANGTVIRPDWNFGKASSTPQSFFVGGSNDICKLCLPDDVACLAMKGGVVH